MRNPSQPNDAIQIITKYELFLKGEKQEDVSNGGQARGLRKKIKESQWFFNHAGLSRLNIYLKIRLCKFLIKFPVLKNASLWSVTC